MSDTISIKGLEVWTRIGVPEEERAHPQRLKVTLVIKVDSVPEAAAADDVRLTIDYALVTALVKEVASAHERRLIETLAEDIARAVLEKFRPGWVEVEIDKFILPETDSVSLSIKRKLRRRDIKLPTRKSSLN